MAASQKKISATGREKSAIQRGLLPNRDRGPAVNGKRGSRVGKTTKTGKIESLKEKKGQPGSTSAGKDAYQTVLVRRALKNFRPKTELGSPGGHSPVKTLIPH